MVYQDRLQTNILQLFAHTKFRMVVYNLLQVNIVAEYVNTKRMTIMGTLLH